MSSGRLTCSYSTCQKIRMQPHTVGPYFYYPKTVSQANLSFCSPFSKLLRNMMNCIPKHIHLELQWRPPSTLRMEYLFSSHIPYLSTNYLSIQELTSYLWLIYSLRVFWIDYRLYPLYLLYAVSCWLFPKTVTNVKNDLYTNPCWLSPITHLCIH